MVSLRQASNVLDVLESGISVVQNNVANMNTPGYVRQTLQLQADRFQPELGIPGGVSSLGTTDSRSDYAERNVRRQLEKQSRDDALVRHVSLLEPLFDISESAGIAGAVNRLFQSFSALTATPNDAAARRTALDRAAELTRAFNSTASSLAAGSREADAEIQSAVTELNAIGEGIRQINLQFQEDYRAQSDAGLNARLSTLLDRLAEIADTSVLRLEDGSVSVSLAGQSPFITGGKLYPASVDISGDSVKVLDSLGRDLTPQLSGGKLAGLIELRNELIPSWTANLDRLAVTLADNINTMLAQGVDLAGAVPTSNLFTYDAAAGAARTLAVEPLDPGGLALASAGSPGGNGNAVALAALGGARLVDDFTLTGFYGALAAQVGRTLSSSSESLETDSLQLTQAQAWRDDISRVDANEEAVLLLQYQRAYQATARLVTVLDEMTETLINILR
jgi:flagellar hook-associated protein 1 FlgK